jgi:hypothetical protein
MFPLTPEGKWHLIELIVLGAPTWGLFLYFMFVLIFFPPHRHSWDRRGNPTIEYPRGLQPGSSQRINGG